MKILSFLVLLLLWGVVTKTYPISSAFHGTAGDIWFVLPTGVCAPEAVRSQKSEVFITASISEALSKTSFVYVLIRHIRKALHPP